MDALALLWLQKRLEIAALSDTGDALSPEAVRHLKRVNRLAFPERNARSPQTEEDVTVQSSSSSVFASLRVELDAIREEMAQLASFSRSLSGRGSEYKSDATSPYSSGCDISTLDRLRDEARERLLVSSAEEMGRGAIREEEASARCGIACAYMHGAVHVSSPKRLAAEPEVRNAPVEVGVQGGDRPRRVSSGRVPRPSRANLCHMVF